MKSLNLRAKKLFSFWQLSFEFLQKCLHHYTPSHLSTHAHLLREGRKPQSKQVNIRSTWQQWCVMRCCSGNKVFVGTLKHSHITSLLILGDQSLVGMATGTWLKPEARPESQCRQGSTHTNTHKNVLLGGKSSESATLTTDQNFKHGRIY